MATVREKERERRERRHPPRFSDSSESECIHARDIICAYGVLLRAARFIFFRRVCRLLELYWE